VTCATYSINWLVFITEMKSVYCEERTGSLSKAVCATCLKGSSRLWLYTELRTVSLHCATNCGCTLSYELWVYTKLWTEGVHWATICGCTLELWTEGVHWATICGCTLSYELRVYTELRSVGVHLSYELWVYNELWTVGLHWATNSVSTDAFFYDFQVSRDHFALEF